MPAAGLYAADIKPVAVMPVAGLYAAALPVKKLTVIAEGTRSLLKPAVGLDTTTIPTGRWALLADPAVAYIERSEFFLVMMTK